MSYVDGVKDGVGFLYADILSRGPNATLEKKPFGTCSFIFAKSPDGLRTFFYLVTAKHVYEDLRALSDGQIYVRVNRDVPEDGEGVAYLELTMEGWLFHPEEAVDLAVYRWNVDLEQNISFVAADLDEIIGTPQFLRNRGGYWPPAEGESTLLIGLMMQHQGVTRNFPIVRHGHVALVTSEPLPAKGGMSEFVLIEGSVYPGNSGAPVFVRFRVDFEARLFLLGILSAAWDTPEELYVRTDSGAKTEYYSLGISKVVPVKKLLDILDSPVLRQERKSAP